MRRLFSLILCLSLVAIPTQEADTAKYVALTFDDGPSGRFTRELLDGLKEREVKATFLLCGYRIAQYPEETARIHDEGHEIGCHGYSHNNMRGMSRRQIGGEISSTTELLDCPIQFLRPPGGCCSDAVRQVAEAKNLAILSWSVDPRDWATSDTASIERSVLEKVKDGDVILLHDMSDSSVTAALDIIDQLQQQGYRFATVSQLAALRGISIVPGKEYSRFPRRDDASEKK